MAERNTILSVIRHQPSAIRAPSGPLLFGSAAPAAFTLAGLARLGLRGRGFGLGAGGPRDAPAHPREGRLVEPAHVVPQGAFEDAALAVVVDPDHRLVLACPLGLRG